MEFLIFFIFNTFTISMSANIKIIPKLCKAGDPFISDHREPTIHGVLSALVKTNKKCLSNYSLLKVKRNRGIFDLEICYDEVSLKTIYVKFEIDGISLKQFVTVIIPPVATRSINLYPENIPCFYTKDHQAALFGYIYKDEDTINDSTFLTEGYLASNADFSEDYKQLGTFFYANITPQWKFINQHVWALIESAIRFYAMDNDKKLEAYAGTHGQTLVDGQPLFLTVDGRLPVATWLWKAVVDQSTGAGIAFICSNNPSESLMASPPCGDLDICLEGHWGDAMVAGWSFCCTLQQLVETVPEAAAAIVDGAGAKLLNRLTPAPPPTSPDSSATTNDGDDDEAEADD